MSMLNIKTEDFRLYLALCPFIKLQDARLILQATLKSTYINLSFHSLNKMGLRSELILEFLIWQKEFDFNHFKKRLSSENIKLLSSCDDLHSNIFKEIACPPAFLFYKGDLSILNRNNVLYLAMVGSRKNSNYGQRVVQEILNKLGSNLKLITISGLARGIDTHVHLESLKNQIPTIAVLGSGLFKERIYPRENIYLANEIVNNGGLLLSEFPPDAQPKREHFPRRNRIISALSRGLLIVEARERSGALITARYGLEQNKEVLAIPGNIFLEEYKGTNRLIQEGAYPVLNYKDIINYFN